MDINVIKELNAELAKVESSILLIESKIGLIAPDLYSAVETKNSLIAIMKSLLQVKDDLSLYSEGKALKSQKDLMMEILKRAGKNPKDFGFPDSNQKNLPDKPNWDMS